MAKGLTNQNMKSLLNELRFTCTKDLSILSAQLLNYVAEHPELNNKDWAFIVELLSKILGLTKAEHSKFKALCNVTRIKLSPTQKAEILRLSKTNI